MVLVGDFDLSVREVMPVGGMLGDFSVSLTRVPIACDRCVQAFMFYPIQKLGSKRCHPCPVFWRHADAHMHERACHVSS